MSEPYPARRAPSAPRPTDPSPAGCARAIVAHYEACFRAHGASARGADWPNAADLTRRFDVMLGLVRAGAARPSLVDFGCGAGLLLDHLEAGGRGDAFDYTGLDLSETLIAAARARHPERRFLYQDVLARPLAPESVDYAVMNGVLTEKCGLSQEAMSAYARTLVETLFGSVRVGLAFNAMSAHVDWTRDDLFHWPFDELFAFLRARVTRHVVIRADYGLFEYTAYLYRAPAQD